MKYIKSIYERLNRETYINAARQSYKNQHHRRSNALFQHVYNFEKLLIQPLRPYHNEDGDYLGLVADSDSGPQEFKLINIYSEGLRNTVGSCVIVLFFMSDSGYKFNLNVCIRRHGIASIGSYQEEDNGILKRMLKSRKSAVIMKRILSVPVREYYRDLLHDDDLDINYLEEYDKSIDMLKISDMYSED